MVEPNKNPFSNREEVWFIDYDGIIRDSNQFLLHKIFNDLYDNYKEFLDIEKYKGASMETCLTYASLLTDRNFIYALRKVEFDCDEAYMELYDFYEDMYKNSDKLLFVNAILKTINKPFCKKIYVYSRYNDKRIESDLLELFGANAKLVYCYGELSKIVNEIPEKITSFFITDYNSLLDVAMYRQMDYTEIFLADYMYNRFVNEEGEAESYLVNSEQIFGDSLVKTRVFTPVLLEPENYSEIYRPDKDSGDTPS